MFVREHGLHVLLCPARAVPDDRTFPRNLVPALAACSPIFCGFEICVSLLLTGVYAGGFVYRRYSNESGSGSKPILVVKEKRPMKNSTQGRKRSSKGIFPAGPDAFHLQRRNIANNYFPGKSSQIQYSRKGATPSASKSTRPAVLWYRSHTQAKSHLGTLITLVPMVAYFSG